MAFANMRVALAAIGRISVSDLANQEPSRSAGISANPFNNSLPGVVDDDIPMMSKVKYRFPETGQLTPGAMRSNVAYLEEYAEVAAAVGIAPIELQVEAFKDVLHRLDFPVYALKEVVAYMDAKAERESEEKAGWCWKPLRRKDHLPEHAFGIDARRKGDGWGPVIDPGRDLYNGPRQFHNNGCNKIYDLLVPLHALKRIAAIEKVYKERVAFMVSDYVLAKDVPHPDPFLMAVIPNARLNDGMGRFVIDFWDEPGFGIKEMLA